MQMASIQLWGDDMASRIWLGGLKGSQEDATIYIEQPQYMDNRKGEATRKYLENYDGILGGAADIAKGNKIEGFEARV